MFLVAPFPNVCVVLVSVQTVFLFARLISFDQTYEVPTLASISHLYYKLSYGKLRGDIYMQQQNKISSRVPFRCKEKTIYQSSHFGYEKFLQIGKRTYNTYLSLINFCLELCQNRNQSRFIPSKLVITSLEILV